ncbi:hypothetical protein GCM10009733_020870 [Nonomuraea maheshkhaliensis]|uniref:VWA domain-containing protein n=1 Tax=Nonomuraea maheshkhaliensis TaxID=419590 RepID=A0ABN2EZW7_9ACTN
MTSRLRLTAPAPGVSPALVEARDELTARTNDIINVLADRDDLLLHVVWNQPDDAPPAMFDPERAEVFINADRAFALGTHPDQIDPTTVEGRLAHPVLVGLCAHESGHARRPPWSAEELHRLAGSPAVAEVTTLLEELCVEALQLDKRPTSRRWLRASAQHVLEPSQALPTNLTPSQQRWLAARAALLVLGRVDVGVLDPTDVSAVTAAVGTEFGQQTLQQLQDLWCEALALAEGSLPDLVEIARRFVQVANLTEDPLAQQTAAALGLVCTAHAGDSDDDADSADAGVPGADLPSPAAGDEQTEQADSAQANPLLAAVAQAAHAVADDTAQQAAADLADLADQQAGRGPDQNLLKSRAQENAARHSAQNQAGKVFGGKGAGRTTSKSGPVRGWRAPNSQERIAANLLAARLRQARFRDRHITVVPSAVPPGRLLGRSAMLGEAQRSQGLPITAQPFRQRRTAHVDQPPLAVGIAVDVSGSMQHTADAMASASWVIAHAAAQIQGRSACAAWGSAVTAVTWPGRPPEQVPQLIANEGTEVLAQAIDALDGALNLATGRGARLLVIASDGDTDNADVRASTRKINRLVANRCGVLWLCLDGTATVLGKAVAVHATTPKDVALALGQAAVTALRQASA